MFNADMKRNSLQSQPYMLNDEATRFEALGALVSIQARTEQTGGAFNLLDLILPTGYETPLHIHYAEEVAIRVLEGVVKEDPDSEPAREARALLSAAGVDA